uniref:Uncharacterized protein n=1 Tax=Macrostomum lignano TaxID=282301 RepID=A0A1I8FGG3_9PLAT
MHPASLQGEEFVIGVQLRGLFMVPLRFAGGNGDASGLRSTDHQPESKAVAQCFVATRCSERRLRLRKQSLRAAAAAAAAGRQPRVRGRWNPSDSFVYLVREPFLSDPIRNRLLLLTGNLHPHRRVLPGTYACVRSVIALSNSSRTLIGAYSQFVAVVGISSGMLVLRCLAAGSPCEAYRSLTIRCSRCTLT